MKSSILRKAILGAALVAAMGAEAKALYFLNSETWRNLGGTGGAAVLTTYAYDARGYRILKGVRNLPDTTGPFQSSTRYVHDGLGRLLRAVLLTGADTSTVVDYTYDGAGNLLAFRSQEKDGTLRLLDTLIYDGQSRLVETRRIADGVLTQSHVYRYDGQGRVVSDTTFEKQGNGFVAAQAIVNEYGPNGAAASEAHFRVSGGTWYQVLTVRFGYEGLQLVSKTTRHGMGGDLRDSTAYAYDAAGNRIKETGFDDEGQPAYVIDYEWRAFGPGAVRAWDRARGPILISAAPRALELRADSRRPLALRIRDARGALLGGTTFAAGSGRWEYPAGLARGRYLAEATQGAERRSIPFTVP